MKKFITAMCSFALVLFLGLAVGCGPTTDAARLRISSHTNTFSVSGTTDLIFTAKEGEEGNKEKNNNISGGIDIVFMGENTYGDEYTITFSEVASSSTYTITANGETVTNSASVTFKDKLTIHIASSTALSGADAVKLFTMKVAATTKNAKKISSFHEATYSVSLKAYVEAAA